MPSPTSVITPPRVPIVDKETGFVTREWYQFLLTLFRLTGNGQNTTSLVDIQLGPATNYLEQSALAAYENVQPNLESYFTVQQDNLLPLASTEVQAQISALQTEIEAIAIQPPPYEPRSLHYASFYDTTTQTAAVINTAYPVTFNTTDISEGIARGTPTSRVVVNDAGAYNFQFSLQTATSSASSHFLYVWARVNGVDVPYSAGRVELKGAANDYVVAWNFVLRMAANDYFELVWSVSDLGISLIASPAVSPVPAIPSAILTVCEVSI